ncbi:unnamed protein product [Leptosia nina]|uniref:Uncharacterized protein n=1 Tax=Leptosia nina TaxID=320188 RepID=A0AAV1JW56_9NEOP
MKLCIICAFSLFICGIAEEFYDGRYDYYDTDYLVQNPRLLKKYMNCFLNRGPCTPIGREFKLVLPEIVRTECSRCTTSQKRLAQRTFEAFKIYLHDDYIILKHKLDPDNKEFTLAQPFPGNMLRVEYHRADDISASARFWLHSIFPIIAAYCTYQRLKFLRTFDIGEPYVVRKCKRINRMKTFIVLVCLVLSVRAVEKYSSKYDNFDVETLINNERLLKSYINCFLDKGRCTSEGADFKKHLPEAIETTCGKCSEKQKNNIRKVIRAIQQKHPKQWDELVKKNDPSGKHRDNFDKFIQSS